MRYFYFAFVTHDSLKVGGGAVAVECPLFPNMDDIKEIIRAQNPEFVDVGFHLCGMFEFQSEEDYRNFIFKR
jgi:hypothetical protein